MSIRLPLKTVLDYDDTTNAGATSVAGGVAKSFVLPLDTDNVVVKFTASVTGSASATFQTTDDGGTTWYDVARTSVVSNANGTTAEWLSVPVAGVGTRTVTSVVAIAGSVLAVQRTTGSSPASTLAAREASGLPLLSQTNRIFLIYTSGTSASSTVRAQVYVNSQANTP